MSINSKPPSKEYDKGFDRIFGQPDCPICKGIGYVDEPIPNPRDDYRRCETCQGTGKTNNK